MKLGCLLVVQLHCYFEPNHGLLASTFKVLIGLPLVILLARHERTGFDEEYFGANTRARTLPSQNACRVKADGMGSTYQRRFPLLKIIWYSAPVALSM